jgi:hypothetical protein
VAGGVGRGGPPQQLDVETSVGGEVQQRAAAGTAGVLRADSKRVLSRIDGQLVVTEPKTAKSKRFVPISQPAERRLRNVRATQAEERSRAGTAWHETAFVFTTEFGGR